MTCGCLFQYICTCWVPIANLLLHGTEYKQTGKQRLYLKYGRSAVTEDQSTKNWIDTARNETLQG